MANRLVSMTTSGIGFSPFADVAVNGMAAMFIFLAIYVAAVPPLDVPPLQVLTTQLPTAVWFRVYDTGINVSGGVGTYRFTIDPDDVLKGIRLHFDPDTGRLSGTPQTSAKEALIAREIPLRVTVEDSTRQRVDTVLRLCIAPVAIPFDPVAQKLRLACNKTQLHDAWVGQAYVETVAILGGIEPYEVTAVGLPPGLTFADGTIQGTPQEDAVPEGQTSREYTISMTVVDQQSRLVPPAAIRVPKLAGSFRLTVRRATPIRIEGLYPSVARAGVPYEGFLVAHGGFGTRRWFLASPDEDTPSAHEEIGLRDSGLTLNRATGRVHGTPRRTGADVRAIQRWSFKVYVKDDQPDAKPVSADVGLTVFPSMHFSRPE